MTEHSLFEILKNPDLIFLHLPSKGSGLIFDQHNFIAVGVRIIFSAEGGKPLLNTQKPFLLN